MVACWTERANIQSRNLLVQGSSCRWKKICRFKSPGLDILDALKLKILVEGYEADDVIGTVATKLKGKVDIIM